MEIRKIIINFLRDGLTQKEIAEALQKMDYKPNSLSSVEKYLKVMRKEYGAQTMFHLAILLIQNNDLDMNSEQGEL